MKLINYKYGYYNEFDCVIHGKIVVSPQEWDTICTYVLNGSVTRDSFWRKVLKEDLQRTYNTPAGNNLYNIRVTATEKVVKHFGLVGYKRANYMFEVVGTQKRLKYLRREIEAERISYGEIAELQGLAKYIDRGDVLLLEWAGVPER